MNLPRVALTFAAGLVAASCSEAPAPERKDDSNTPARREPVRVPEVGTAERKAEPPPPSQGKIGKDCVAFLRSTKVVPATGASTDCPGCPLKAAEVLTVRQINTDAISCSGDTCNVVVTIRAVFNPAAGEAMAGGLTAWISPEQRSAYLNGQTPEGEQEFRANVTYKRQGPEWRVVEFERPVAQ